MVKNAVSQFYTGEQLTILDIGTNTGGLIAEINKEKHFSVTGIEIFGDVATKAKQTGFYNDVIVGDVMKYAFKKQYDLVFCSHLIEHLPKTEGLQLLDRVENIAKKGIIFITPKGFQKQSETKLQGNPFEAHISGWEPYEFEQRGYQVIPVSFKPVFYLREITEKYTLLGLVASAISVLMQPITSQVPLLALYMICIKKK